MQAHVYSRLQHVTPGQVDRMAQEQWDQGVDGVIWPGYGDTFPLIQPESWERAATSHRRLESGLRLKPVPELAVFRPYSEMALLSSCEEGQIRNPEDWFLQQFLEIWAVQLRKPYDVYELPPVMNAKQKSELIKELKKYNFIVSSTPWKKAWNVGKNED